MNQPGRIDDMQSKTLQRAGFRVGDYVVIARVGVHDATAPRRDALETSLVHWLEECQNRPGLSQVLSIDQLLAGAELAGSDVVLHIGDDEWYDNPRL